MTTNGTETGPPPVVRRLESDSSAALADLVGVFDDLQMVLRCCEWLVAELAGEEADGLLVESVWTTALLCYTRCFADGAVRLTEEDLDLAMPEGEPLAWHQVLGQLREHQADLAANPRERFSVGVTQDPGGAASGVAITSARQPLPDDVTVRQTGALVYALAGLVNRRIEERQAQLFEELRAMPAADLESLEEVELGPAAQRD